MDVNMLVSSTSYQSNPRSACKLTPFREVLGGFRSPIASQFTNKVTDITFKRIKVESDVRIILGY